jgi:hypothetical protein
MTEPAQIPHRELVALLDEISIRVERGDSSEGSIIWAAAGGDAYDVSAAYRVGTRDGEGGWALCGVPAPKTYDDLAIRELIVYTTKYILYNERLLGMEDGDPRQGECLDAVRAYYQRMKDSLDRLGPERAG